MKKKDHLSDYSKRRDPSPSEDAWAKIKPWRDPIGNAGKPNDTGTLPEIPAGKLRNKPTDSVA
jgi:hypothetical protein